MDKGKDEMPANEDGMSGDEFRSMMDSVFGSGENPKPDTAQGVASLMAAARHDAENQNRDKLVYISDPKTGGGVHAVLSADGGIDFIDETRFELTANNPSFRRGVASMTSLVSFIDHVNRFGDEDSAVFADDDRASPSLTAVLDYHRQDGGAIKGEFRHGLHRTKFAFPVSDEWTEWQLKNEQPMSMHEFSVFLENNMGDIALVEDGVPESAKRFVETNGGNERIADYASLIELSRGLRINENSVVEEAVNLASGEGKIRLSNEHAEAKVGDVTITVPTMFFIAIPVFRNGDYYRLPARLRYRKGSNGLVFWFDLWRSDRAFDTAFRENCEKVDAGTEAQLFYGSPE